MKLRISGDSIRLRLSFTDVYGLINSGSITETCHIGNGILTYKISHNHENKLLASHSDGIIDVKIPKEWLTNWDIDERIGFDGHDSNGLYILIEKDFQCMKPRPQEDETDLYKNPNANNAFHG